MKPIISRKVKKNETLANVLESIKDDLDGLTWPDEGLDEKDENFGENDYGDKLKPNKPKAKPKLKAPPKKRDAATLAILKKMGYKVK